MSIYITEIPDEICLGISVLGCPIHCPDCHSQHVWDINSVGKGKELTYDIIRDKLTDNSNISCVLLFGGDWEPNRLTYLLMWLHEIYRVKTALYTGRTLEYINNLDLEYGFTEYLDYLKVGAYNKELGGLNSPTTNQRLYKLEKVTTFVDMTNVFWRKIYD